MSYADASLSPHYFEVPYSVNESGGFDATPKASVRLNCAWGQRFTVVDDIVNNLRTWPHSGPLSVLPLSHAAITPVPQEVFAATANGNAIPYIRAFIDLTYSFREYKNKETDGTIISESYEPYLEYLPCDFKAFSWAKNNDTSVTPVEDVPIKVGEAPSFPIPLMKIQKTFHRIQTLNPAWWNLLGKCNDSQIILPAIQLTCAPETLCLLSVTPKRDIAASGIVAGWSVTTETKWKSTGWNVYFHPETQTWRRMMRRVYTPGNNATWIDYWVEQVPKASFAPIYQA